MKTFFKENWAEIIVIKISTIGIAVLCCCACQPSPIERLNDWLKVRDDNVMEEMAEYVIEAELDLDIDLSPRSPED